MTRSAWESLCLWVKVVAAMLAALWEGLTPLVQALIVFMVLDLLTGLLAGFVSRSLSSDVSFRGVAKKAIVLLLVGAAAVVEPAVGLPLAQVVAGFYAVHEGLSALENAARAGLPVPRQLRDALVKLSADGAAQGKAREGAGG